MKIRVVREERVVEYSVFRLFPLGVLLYVGRCELWNREVTHTVLRELTELESRLGKQNVKNIEISGLRMFLKEASFYALNFSHHYYFEFILIPYWFRHRKAAIAAFLESRWGWRTDVVR